MNSIEHAKRIVRGLDEARRNSSRERPVHEVELIAAGLDDFAERYVTALRKIASADTGPNLGRCIDIARQALVD